MSWRRFLFPLPPCHAISYHSHRNCLMFPHSLVARLQTRVTHHIAQILTFLSRQLRSHSHPNTPRALWLSVRASRHHVAQPLPALGSRAGCSVHDLVHFSVSVACARAAGLCRPMGHDIMLTAVLRLPLPPHTAHSAPMHSHHVVHRHCASFSLPPVSLWTHCCVPCPHPLPMRASLLPFLPRSRLPRPSCACQNAVDRAKATQGLS